MDVSNLVLTTTVAAGAFLGVTSGLVVALAFVAAVVVAFGLGRLTARVGASPERHP